MGQKYFEKRGKKRKMIYLKRKDGSVIGKINPSKEQIAAYKKDGCVLCDENGKEIKEKKSAKKSTKR